jgi:mannitol/fructose-specific phosphotransferase system IIA component (Ntr-type)
MPASILRQALRPEVVKLRLEATTKDEAIRELVQILDDAGCLPDPAEALRVVEARERVMSTGMENGLAIPHGKTDTVPQLVVAMGLKPEGIEFDSVDGDPATILLMTVSPASKSGPHLRFMADVTRLLRDGQMREQVLTAESANEVVGLLVQN